MGVKLVSSSAGSVELVAPVTASNYTATMPAGTGNVVVNGVNSSIVSGTAVASTSGTSIDFTSIPSWVKRITLMFNGVSHASSGVVFLVQIGTSSGIESSSYASLGMYYLPTTIVAANNTSGFVINAPSDSDIVTGHMVLTLQGSNTWVQSHNMGQAAATVTATGVGSKTLSGTLDRVRITTNTGAQAFDAGSINILYE